MNWDVIINTLQGASHIATVGLLIVAAIGLKQLSISKKAANATAKRDSIKAANEQIRYFGETIIPLVNKMDTYIAKNNITLLDESSFEIKDDRIEVALRPNGAQGAKQFNMIGEHVLAIINNLEILSTVFVSGLADEKVAFKTIGKAYCSITEKCMPIIATITEHDKHYYQNSIELYRCWNDRIEKSSLQEQKKEIENELSRKGKSKKIVQLNNVDD